MKDEVEGEIPAEVDFSGGVRGKYAGRVLRDAVYVPLETDVSEAFRTAEDVNAALRMLMKTAVAAVPQKEQRAS